MRLLLDEMYSPALATALRASGMDAVAVIALRMAGTSDAEVFAYGVANDRAVLTENVADFVAIAAQHSTTGAHHPGLLIALSSRFTRRAAAYGELIEAIASLQDADLADRIVYLEAAMR